jgi:hypothetical protein
MEFDTGRASRDGIPVALAEPTRLENMPKFVLLYSEKSTSSTVTFVVCYQRITSVQRACAGSQFRSCGCSGSWFVIQRRRILREIGFNSIKILREIGFNFDQKQK